MSEDTQEIPQRRYTDPLPSPPAPPHPSPPPPHTHTPKTQKEREMRKKIRTKQTLYMKRRINKELQQRNNLIGCLRRAIFCDFRLLLATTYSLYSTCPEDPLSHS